MNDFLINYFEKLKLISSSPELELKILINKSSINNKEIIISNIRLEDIDLIKFKIFFDRRIKREPISKIFNSKSFWKNDFFVNSDVLDPRPETELIIENVLRYYPNQTKDFQILDICTGSGCLAISLAKEYPNSNITATDISLKALDVAKINANNLNCSDRIEFIKNDIFQKKKKFDIIVSNPPYLSELEYGKTSEEIRGFEPKIALVALNNGYEFYYKIANILPKILSNQSKVFLEIGSSQAEKVINIFKSYNINCLKVAKDIQNFNRLLILNKT